MRNVNSWLALIALALAALMIGLDATVLNVALPTLADDLHANTSELQWIVNAYVLLLAGAMLPAGVLGDRYGRRRLLQIGMLVFLIGSLGCALTSHIGVLIGMRAFMGLGAAIIMPIVLAMVPIMFNDEDRPRAVGAMTAALAIGVPLGPIVGGYLLNHFSWNSIFWINVPVGIIAMVAVATLVQESRAKDRPRLDVPGTLLSTAGIVALVYGFIEAPESGWTAPDTVFWIAAGCASLIGFVIWEARTKTALIDLSLFQNRRFTGGSIAMALLQFVMYGLLFTLPQYLQAVRGFDAFGTGLRLIPMMAGLLVAAGASKRILVHIGPRRGTVAGAIIAMISLLVLARITPDMNMAWIFVWLAVFGAGAGVTMTSSMDAVLGSLPQDQEGAGSAVSSTIRQLAGALGVAILGSMLFSIYRTGLDPALLSPLSAPEQGAVRDSIMGATQIAALRGTDGTALHHMASNSYTHAMAVLLIVSAIAGGVSAIAGGIVIPETHASHRSRQSTPGAQIPRDKGLDTAS